MAGMLNTLVTEPLFTMLDVLHLQMQAGYEDANCLRAFPIQQFNNLEKQKQPNVSIYLFKNQALLSFKIHSSLLFVRDVIAVQQKQTCNYLFDDNDNLLIICKMLTNIIWVYKMMKY